MRLKQSALLYVPKLTSADGQLLRSFLARSVAFPGVDPPAAPQLLEQQLEACTCAAAMQDSYLACHDAYQLLPVSSCTAPDAAVQRQAAELMLLNKPLTISNQLKTQGTSWILGMCHPSC